MKFLCEQCKAKYQIDDAKVAGKTVRMKCRKCGHLIEVRAEVTETSVATALPQGDETRVGAPDPAILAAQKAAQTPAPPPRPGAPLKPQPQKLATSLASAKPQPHRPSNPAPAQSALAGAFNKSVQRDDDALLELSTTAEWYVAINGVPVGPIRLSELRRKAASGAITEDSLCWQEGLEEWRPLKTVTELAAIVREAAATARPSLANPPLHEAHGAHTPAPSSNQPSRPPTRGAPSPAQGPGRVEAPKPGAMAARSNVVSLSSRLATAEKLDALPEPEEHTVISDPFAAIAPQPTPAPPVAADSSAAALPLVAASATGATSAPFGAPAPVALEAAPPQKKGTNWIAVAMVVLAAAFGVTAAIAIFFRGNQNVAPQVTTVFVSATATTPTPTATAVATADPTATVTASASGTVVAAAGTYRGTGGTAPVATTAKTIDNSAIANLLGGPSTGPGTGPGGGTSGAAGGGLSDKAVQDAVRNYTPGVKRTCWERGGSAESTAIVDVTVTVAPNGNVSNAVATGNDPLVAKCIENQVRNWRFSAPGEVTTIKIPFKFLKQ